VNDLFLLAFATRRDGPASAQVRTAAELLGDATEPQAKAVLSAVRKVILKWCRTPALLMLHTCRLRRVSASPSDPVAPAVSSAYPAGLDAAGVVKQLPADTNGQLAKLIAQIGRHCESTPQGLYIANALGR
jgi:hypothetical protein